MTATCHPADRHRDATADAADPVPMTTRSNFLVTLSAYSCGEFETAALYPVSFTTAISLLVSVFEQPNCTVA
jgi:hypothetical protein